jgi:hypothetical protein
MPMRIISVPTLDPKPDVREGLREFAFDSLGLGPLDVLQV